ncbi:MAG: GspMb/PilO family protein [Acidobacteriota bacterium]
MSQERPMTGPALTARRQIPIRLDQLRRAPGLNALGLPELIGLAGAVLILLITIVAYFYFYVPAHSRRKALELERARLQAQLHSSEATFTNTTTTSQEIKEIDASLRDFESNWLASISQGRLSLYSELNNLIRSNGLRNTSGPTYTPLQPLGTKAQVQATATADKQSSAKWQSIYPGIAVSVTVEGPYQNVRHFVRDLETSRQFLIINAVELESLTQTSTSQDLLSGTAPAAPRSGKPMAPGRTAPPAVAPLAGGRTLVSLRLDLATYFQRPASESGTAP